MNNTLNITYHASQISSLASKIYGSECTAHFVSHCVNKIDNDIFIESWKKEVGEHLEYLLDLLKEDDYPELTRYTIKKKGDKK